MAFAAVVQPPAGLNPSSSQPTYATLFKTDTNPTPTISLKLKEVSYVHGEPTILFETTEIDAYIRIRIYNLLW